MSYPSTWKKIKFGDIAKRKSVRIDNPKESEYERYVGLEHLDSGEFVVKRWGSTKDVSSNMQIFNKNDILFARRNTYLKRISVALFDGICSGDIIVIEPILNHIVEGFLPMYMQFEEFENKVVAWSAGAFSKRIKWKQLSDFEIWIPSKEEQQRMVNIIWSIHENQERTENLVQVTEKIKKGLLEELLTKGIGHKKFKETELGEIPEEWNIQVIDDICTIRRGASPRPIDNKKYFSDSGPGWIRISDVTSVYKFIRNTEQYLSELGESKSVRVKKGDLIMSICATIGKPVFIDMDACIHDGFVLFQNIKSNVSPDYLFYVLLRNEVYFKSQKQEGTQGNLNTTIVGNTKIPVPNTLTEQKKIVNIFSNIDESLDELKNHYKHLSELKKKLTTQFLSGNLLIPEEVLN